MVSSGAAQESGALVLPIYTQDGVYQKGGFFLPPSL